jgi:hypothetical protein
MTETQSNIRQIQSSANSGAPRYSNRVELVAIDDPKRYILVLFTSGRALFIEAADSQPHTTMVTCYKISDQVGFGYTVQEMVLGSQEHQCRHQAMAKVTLGVTEAILAASFGQSRLLWWWLILISPCFPDRLLEYRVGLAQIVIPRGQSGRLDHLGRQIEISEGPQHFTSGPFGVGKMLIES